MSGLLPRRPPVDAPARDRVEVPPGDDALDALGCETARAVLDALIERPGPLSDVAGRLDVAVQTVDYHVDNLRAAGLIERAGTWYSERGVEMPVYAPAADRLVVPLDGAATTGRECEGE